MMQGNGGSFTNDNRINGDSALPFASLAAKPSLCSSDSTRYWSSKTEPQRIFELLGYKGQVSGERLAPRDAVIAQELQGGARRFRGPPRNDARDETEQGTPWPHSTKRRPERRLAAGGKIIGWFGFCCDNSDLYRIRARLKLKEATVTR
jgi:hypothetical protein